MMLDGPENGTAQAVPSLVSKRHTRSQETEKLIVRRCNCRRTWCPKCSLNAGIKRFYERIKDWDYRYVRQIILSVDREKYASPLQALQTITRKKHISNLMRDLKRTRGIEIQDWAWILEWHRDGFPHWHLFVKVADKGKAGMIGHEGIDYYWKSGFVWEGPINNAKHWQALTGYFAKKGYFEKKKAHQAHLPAWAKDRVETIRRTGSKASPDYENQNIQREKYIFQEERRQKGETPVQDLLMAKKLGHWMLDQAKADAEPDKKTQGEKLAECGESVDLHVFGTLHGHIGVVKMPYRVLRHFAGEYRPGVGYVVDLDRPIVQELKPLLDWEQQMILIENTNERILQC